MMIACTICPFGELSGAVMVISERWIGRPPDAFATLSIVVAMPSGETFCRVSAVNSPAASFLDSAGLNRCICEPTTSNVAPLRSRSAICPGNASMLYSLTFSHAPGFMYLRAKTSAL